MKFDMTTPCDNCPFRTEPPFYGGLQRAQEIADALERGQTFQCHKTVEYVDSDDNDGETSVPTPGDQHCAGALILLERNGMPGQLARIAERFGMYDPSKLDMDAPVYDDLEQFVEAMEALA